LVRLRHLTLAALAPAPALAGCGDAGCGNAVLQDLPSPEGRRHAVVFTRDCGATTAFSTQVSVLPSDHDTDVRYVADTAGVAAP
jgi:hypothetical protein